MFDELLTAPDVGEVLDLGHELVECRKCPCCPEDSTSGAPRFYVYTSRLELVAMASSFRRLAHHRRWQMDPQEVWRYPQSWPEEEMTIYQLAQWRELRVHLDLGDIADPVPAAHPLAVSRRAPRPAPGRAADLRTPRPTDAPATEQRGDDTVEDPAEASDVEPPTGGGPVIDHGSRQVPVPAEGGCEACCSTYDGPNGFTLLRAKGRSRTCPRCGSTWDPSQPFYSQLLEHQRRLADLGWEWTKRARSLSVLTPPGQQRLAL